VFLSELREQGYTGGYAILKDWVQPKWHPVFKDFARYWGFRPRLCQLYRAQTKGKVESIIRYLKGHFLCGPKASCLENMRGQFRAWTHDGQRRRG
jgi:transposase